ncbi:MAG TPA: preprotein translocase subunit SecY [Lentisphaeria bacterium]|nr:MAG: preprotein translocase subunit SecY [Lentisphaerae bacterium GWF2_50_93]HCE43462.1 preprotein translocase subunit SecY [Lentisphaeria bacterium]
MFSAFTNSFKIKELRNKILIVLGIIALSRLAANIPCPGVDPAALKAYFETNKQLDSASFMSLFDLFSGGALGHFAIATLGIMPYISASIIMQLLIPVIPNLEKMAREGDSGRQKIHQYTRYLTVIICIVQGAMAAMAMISPSRLGLPTPTQDLVLHPGPAFVFMTVIILTCGTMFLMWLGEQITHYGIGNGASMIITVSIISRMPASCFHLFDMAASGQSESGEKFKPVQLLILLIIFALVTAATILITQGQRRIPIQMAKRIVGFNKMKGGTTYMPLKVNFSGVMPIIFASAILMFPPMILAWIPTDLTRSMTTLFNNDSISYMAIYGFMILIFSYFWVANQFNPIQISENLKKEGAYIPGIRPGKPTAEFLDHTMTRLTLAGAIFLTALALFPTVLYTKMSIPYMIASFFGGTSLLIIVGVMLDTLSQMESHLVMRNYDGFLKRGRLRSRRTR